MILADTSRWIDYLYSGDAKMAALLEDSRIVMHEFVIGEIAMGSLHRRTQLLNRLWKMPQIMNATTEEVLIFVDQHKLFSLGIGLIDAHLLASAILESGTTLWTRDKRLHAAAANLGVAAEI